METKTMSLAADLSAYAADYQPQLALLLADMAPAPWLTRLEDWLGLCRTDPATAMSEPALAEALAQMVSLMHARMQFGLLEAGGWARSWVLVTADERGGAVLAAAARADLMRFVTRHDRALAARLAAVTLQRIEDQRAAIASLINAQQLRG